MFEHPIHDMILLQRTKEGSPGVNLWPVLSFNDHLLRRFGFIQAIQIEPEHSIRPRVRELADELIFMLDGMITACLKDLRTESRSAGVIFRAALSAGDLLLIPFGVAFKCQAGSLGSTFLRISTHEEDDSAPVHSIDWEDQ